MGKVYADLEVNGGFIYNNNPTSGYNLTTDSNGLVSWTQSSVIEAADYASLPASGLGSRLYITLNNNNTYRWDGAAYQPITGLLLTTNIIYVSRSGNDALGARHDLGKPFLTVEAAVSVAQSGDLIKVFPGTYSVASNIAKDGIGYYLEPGAVIIKTTSGDIFDTTGFTTGFDVFGHGEFRKTTSSGYVCRFCSSLAYTFQARRVTSTVSHIFVLEASAAINFDVEYVTASGGACLFNYSGSSIKIKAHTWTSSYTSAILGNWWLYSSLTIDAVTFSSSAGVTIIYMNTSCILNLNIDNFIGVNYSISIGDGYNMFISINSAYCTGINAASYEANHVRVLGHVVNYSGNCNTIMSSCTNLNVTGGFCTVRQMSSSVNAFTSISQSGGVLDITIDKVNYGISFTVTGGIMNINGVIAAGQTSINSDRLVNGGTVNVYARFSHGYGLDPSYNGYAALKLQSGTLRICNGVHNVGNHPIATGIEWIGGNLIFQNATIVTSNPLAHAVRCQTPGLTMSVIGNLSTNRVELDALLAPKYMIWYYAVGSAAATQIVINGTFVTESDAVTYNTTALLAQRMVSLINANVSINTSVFAYQDSPGTDTFFYVRSFTKGPLFTTQNSYNTSISLIQLNSYQMGTQGSGLIVCDSKISF